MTRIELEWYFVEATTSDFQTSYAEDGNITLIKLNGGAGATVFVNRNDSDLWAPQPSTLFYPGSGSSENRGFLLVSAEFFANHGVSKTTYTGDPPKYPRTLGDLARAALELVQRLHVSAPEPLASATQQLDERARNLIANFLAATSTQP
jgi:hypothetical protein